MYRAKTSRLVTGTLAGLLTLIPLYGCNRQVETPQTDNQPNTTVIELQEKNQKLKERVKELEEKGCDPKNPAYIELKNTNYELETKNAELEGCLADQKLKCKRQWRDNNKLELRIDELQNPEGKAWDVLRSRLEKRLKSFVVDSVAGDYSYDSIKKLFNEEKVTYDKERLTETWKKFSPEEREAFFLAYLDKDSLYQSYDERKKARYEEFFRNGIKPEDKISIPRNIGIQGSLDEKYSPLSLGVFEVYEKVSLPPIR